MNEAGAEALDTDRDNALRYLVETPLGRKAVYDWMAHCGVTRSSFNRDPLLMAFNEGRRDVGLWMLMQLEQLKPGILQLMRAEHEAREQRYHTMPDPEGEDDE